MTKYCYACRRSLPLEAFGRHLGRVPVLVPRVQVLRATQTLRRQTRVSVGRARAAYGQTVAPGPEKGLGGGRGSRRDVDTARCLSPLVSPRAQDMHQFPVDAAIRRGGFLFQGFEDVRRNPH